MRSVAGVALIAPARGRASKKIINIMHTGAARCFWKPKWPWVKTKPPKPPKPSTTGRAVCNARFLLREVHVSGGAIRCVHRKGAPDRKPTPNAETWESRSALATRHRRQHVQRMFGTSTRSGFRRSCGPASWRPPSDLVDQVHVSGALSGACTGKGPQIANPRPTPKPGNLGPPWPPGTGGDPAGYSRGRPLGGSRLSLVRSGSPGADAARL